MGMNEGRMTVDLPMMLAVYACKTTPMSGAVPYLALSRSWSANTMESCVATTRSMIDRGEVNLPNYYTGWLEVVARFARDVQAFLRGLLPSRDPNDVSGNSIRPIHLLEY